MKLWLSELKSNKPNVNRTMESDVITFKSFSVICNIL